MDKMVFIRKRQLKYEILKAGTQDDFAKYRRSKAIINDLDDR